MYVGHVIPPFTYNVNPNELLCMVEAGLEELRQIVVLRRTNESGDVEARERARAGVKVRQKDPEGLTVKLNYGKLQENMFWPMSLLSLKHKSNSLQFAPVLSCLLSVRRRRR